MNFLRNFGNIRSFAWFIALNGEPLKWTLAILALILFIFTIVLIIFLVKYKLKVIGRICMSLFFSCILAIGAAVMPTAQSAATVFCFTNVLRLRVVPSSRTPEEKQLVNTALLYFGGKMTSEELEAATKIAEEPDER